MFCSVYKYMGHTCTLGNEPSQSPAFHCLACHKSCAVPLSYLFLFIYFTERRSQVGFRFAMLLTMSSYYLCSSELECTPDVRVGAGPPVCQTSTLPTEPRL